MLMRTLAGRLTLLWAVLSALLLAGAGCLSMCYRGSLLFPALLALGWGATLVCGYLTSRWLTAPLTPLLADLPPGAAVETPLPSDELGRLVAAVRAQQAELARVRVDQHQLNAILDSLPVPIFYRDLAGHYLGVNRAYENYLGRDRAALIGKSVFEIFPPEIAQIYYRADRELQLNGGVQQYENQIVHADGASRDVIFYKASFLSSEGVLAGVVGTLLDITDRKQMETLLAEQKEFSENLVQNLAVPAFVLNQQHEVIIWNRACEELTGLAADQVIGTRRQWAGFYLEENPTQADLVLDADYREADNRYNPLWFRSTLIPGGMHGEGWGRNCYGLDGYLLFSSAPVKNSSGEVIAAIQTVEDITARKQSEDQLRTLSLAVEQSPSMVIITDTAGTIEYVNHKFVEVTGYSSAEAVGQNPRLLKSGNTPDELYQELWEAVSAGREWRGEFQNKKKNGELYREQAMVAPVHDDRGVISHFIALKEDVTERQALEEALRHAQKMESLGTLTGGVAHDFNNILTAIIGYANLIQMNSGSGDLNAKFSAQVVASAEKAAVLTRGLLAYSKNQAMHPNHLNLNDIVQRVDRLLSRVLGEGITVSTTLNPEPLRLFADTAHLEQVLMNLAVNARDAMPGGGTLSIRTEEVQVDAEFVRLHGFGRRGRFALLSVADNGIGLDQATRERIFEPFFTTHGLGGRPGLGLSIVHGIVEQHKGFIEVESAPGKGSNFRIYLPLTQPVVPRLVQAAPRKSGGGKTVLLVEDNPEVRAIIGEVLRSEQYQVLEAGDSEEALRRFSRHSGEVSLLLVDVIMPGKGGLDLYREIRMLDPRVRVLFMSGYSEDYIRSQGMFTKDFNFISKPLAPADLLNRVHDVLDAA
ncbi:hypothetical protein GMLC_13910 [Geomonas limicola]|uniref:histidine kinase n=1 Tax=Geomonas limicola TaxID=2740186 RepID=A0A6V8N5H2_9BACT|nr:PAS domain-containing sensor histidine kinase [Geomonas limicola]GFO67812.1 hypothetical protein GMLC_13910 [Geomonas limicola]